MSLPAPKSNLPVPVSKPVSRAHHFDAAHGDVAALHARIERSFADGTYASPPRSPLAERLEASVQAVSRAAGPVALIAALGALGLVLF